MNKKDRDLEFSKKEHNVKLDKSLDTYSIWLIKVVGVVGVILGLAILGSFWFWVMKMLFKVGA